MGRNTFESIGKVLPNRQNIVITRNEKWTFEGVQVTHSVHDAIQLAELADSPEVFIIGGAEIYKQTLPIADKLYITRVETEIENGQAFFPLIDENIWQLSSSVYHQKDEKNIFNCCFEVYTKREPVA